MLLKFYLLSWYIYNILLKDWGSCKQMINLSWFKYQRGGNYNTSAQNFSFYTILQNMSSELYPFSCFTGFCFVTINIVKILQCNFTLFFMKFSKSWLYCLHLFIGFFIAKNILKFDTVSANLEFVWLMRKYQANILNRSDVRMWLEFGTWC